MAKKIIISIVMLILLAGSACGIYFGIQYYNIKDSSQYEDSAGTVELVNELRDKIEILIDDNNELIVQVNDLKALDKENKATIEDYKKQVQKISDEKEEAEDKIDELNSQIDILEEEKSRLESQSEIDKAEIERINGLLETAEADKVQLQNEVAEKQSEIDSLNRTISELEIANASLQETVQELRQQIVSLSSTITLLQQEIEKLEGIIDTLERENFATVIFEIDDEIVSTQSVKKGTHPNEVTNDKLNTESFDGWKVKGTEEIVDPYTYDIEENVTFVAVFSSVYDVTFMYEDEVKSSQQVKNGKCADDVEIENTKYKIFNGWKVNDEIVDVSTYKIYADTTFVADIIYYYDVTFMVEGSQYKTQTVLKDSTVASPGTPTKENFSFKGWTVNGTDIVDLSTYQITENTTFTALFEVNLKSNKITLSNGDILTSSSSSSDPGIYLYDASEKTLTQIFDEEYNWRYGYELPNGDALISSTRPSSGLLLYNNSTQTITLVDSTSSYTNKFIKYSDEKIFLSSNNDIRMKYLYCYDVINKTLTEVYTLDSTPLNGYGYSSIKIAANGNCIIYGTNMPSVYYNAETDSYKASNAGRFSTSYYEEVGNDKYLSKGSIASVYVYDLVTDERVQLFKNENSSNSQFRYNEHFRMANGNYLITTSESKQDSNRAGVLLYDSTSNTVTKIYASEEWDTFEEVEGGVKISNSKDDSVTLYYDFENGTCTPIEDDVETTELNLVA